MSVDPDEAQTDVTGRRSATQSDLRIAQNEHGIAGLPSQLFRLGCGEEMSKADGIIDRYRNTLHVLSK